MNTREPRDSVRQDPTGLRANRVVALRDLVGRSIYEIPSEDVAASIIRDAIVISAPGIEVGASQGSHRAPPPEV